MTEYGKDDKALILPKLQNGTQEWQGDSFAGMDFSEEKLKSFQANECQLTGLRWSHSYLEEMVLRDSNVSQCRFDHFNCQKIKLRQSEWEACNCQEARFSQAQMFAWKVSDGAFQNAQLSKARIVDTRFQNCEFSGSDWQGAVVIRTQFTTDNYLGGNDFRRANLAWALFLDVKLENADFTQANLEGTVFVGVDLKNARFEQVDVKKATFINCRSSQ
jgi:uncharacterized protein YjbI with pentapeptide repeats